MCVIQAVPSWQVAKQSVGMYHGDGVYGPAEEAFAGHVLFSWEGDDAGSGYGHYSLLIQHSARFIPCPRRVTLPVSAPHRACPFPEAPEAAASPLSQTGSQAEYDVLSDAGRSQCSGMSCTTPDEAEPMQDVRSDTDSDASEKSEHLELLFLPGQQRLEGYFKCSRNRSNIADVYAWVSGMFYLGF